MQAPDDTLHSCEEPLRLRYLMQIIQDRDKTIAGLTSTRSSRDREIEVLKTKLAKVTTERNALRRLRWRNPGDYHTRMYWEQKRAKLLMFKRLFLTFDSIPLSLANADIARAPERRFFWRWLTFCREQAAWKHWMRLGTLNQYPSVLCRADRIPVRPTSAASPVISVVTPSFNQGIYLERTMRSILDQNYPHLEYVVMDGGSTDESPAIIQRYASHLHFWQSCPDGGQSKAIHDGFTRCTGKIMAWLNSDDIIFPGTLAYVADYFEKHPDVDLVYGNRIIIDSNDREVGRWILPRHDPDMLFWNDFVPQETMFWRKDIYDKIGGLNPDFQFALDWDLLVRMQSAGAKMVRLPYFLGGFRAHELQKTSVWQETVGKKEIALLRERYLGKNFTLARLWQRIVAFQWKAKWHANLLAMGIRM